MFEYVEYETNVNKVGNEEQSPLICTVGSGVRPCLRARVGVLCALALLDRLLELADPL